MLPDTPREGIEVSNSSEVYRGAVWGIVREDFRFGEEVLTRDFLQHMGAVAILAVNDREEILTIRQYRHAVGMDMTEIPAGLIDSIDEDPFVAAQRELKEETGFEAHEWSVLVDMCNSPGSSTETLRIYLAKNLVELPWDSQELSGEEREIRREWVSLEDALASVIQGEWQSPSAVVGVLAYVSARNKELRSPQSPWFGRNHNINTQRVFER